MRFLRKKKKKKKLLGHVFIITLNVCLKGLLT